MCVVWAMVKPYSEHGDTPSELPEARIEAGPIQRALTWVWHMFKSAMQIGVVFLFATFGYCMAATGCENKAITFAHATAPDLKCSAINTHVWLAYEDKDSAICTRGTERWLCTWGNSGYDLQNGCKPL